MVDAQPSISTIDQDVYRVLIEGINVHLTTYTFSTNDPKSSYPVAYSLIYLMVATGYHNYRGW